MNCEQVRALLPEHLYADVPPAEQDDLRKHLAQCPNCAEVWRGLQGVRQMLDAAPAPAVQIDLPLLYQQARELDQRHTRRWRRLAWAASAAAVILLILTALRFEVRWHEREIVFGWGMPPPPPPALRVPEDPAIPAALLADLQLMKDLIHSIAADMDERDQEYAAALSDLETRLDAVKTTSNRRWWATQNDVRALYTAYFGTREKGAIP